MNGQQNISIILETIGDYYEECLGRKITIPLKPICFCNDNDDCFNMDPDPMTSPDPKSGTLQIHLTTSIVPNYYPSQITYQFSHELWHVYEFQEYGVDYDWEKYQGITEPYAHAASLCVLAANILPESILKNASQRTYFVARQYEPTERNIYKPGIALAEEVGYRLSDLYKRYCKEAVYCIK